MAAKRPSSLAAIFKQAICEEEGNLDKVSASALDRIEAGFKPLNEILKESGVAGKKRLYMVRDEDVRGYHKIFFGSSPTDNTRTFVIGIQPVVWANGLGANFAISGDSEKPPIHTETYLRRERTINNIISDQLFFTLGDKARRELYNYYQEGPKQA